MYRNLSILVLYHLGFNQKIHLGLIALINFHLGCSTPSHVLGRCPLFNLGLHQNVIVGLVLWAYYTSPLGCINSCFHWGQLWPFNMILLILHPFPWATEKVATHGPYYVTLWPQIAALG